MNYVAGFLFSLDRQSVALIEKKKGPPVIVGKWNAIGGKVEEGEGSPQAMKREFIEETGVGENLDWVLFMNLCGNGWNVDFYHAFDNLRIESMEQEKVSWYTLRELPNVVPNLRWIIPMALGHLDDHVRVYYVSEHITT
jgi:8-oxo-dGTP pyrophosphatase MutT (NUDIX family)